MDDKNALLRGLPSVDELIRRRELLNYLERFGHNVVSTCIRRCLDATRTALLQGTLREVNIEAILGDVEVRIDEETRFGLRPVINATGVILHTNLGRAPLSPRIAEHVAGIISHYNSLEFNLAEGTRGSRAVYVAAQLKRLTGAEAAVITNNNAAAVMLVLSALCADRQVVVSRGELVEIGGAFRIPEVMEMSGAALCEVGTTNKTRFSDYERAVCEDTAALLKVHTSNYRVVGFTEEAGIGELKPLADRFGIPLIYDLGSGSLIDLSPYGIKGEPTVCEALAAGADIVCFSGDKLLGGPQCGIIVGSKRYLDKMAQHPLMRALRVDKMALAALEATLQLYLDDETARRNVPILAMLCATQAELQSRSERVAGQLNDAGIPAEVITADSVLGGGSAPTEHFPSPVVAIAQSERVRPESAAHRLMQQDLPVIARIENDKLLFDLRTVGPEEEPKLLDTIMEVLNIHDA